MTSQAYLETSAAIRILSRKIGRQHGKISQVISLKKTKRNALNAVYDFITKAGKVSRCALFIGKKDIENDIQKQHRPQTTDTLNVQHVSSSEAISEFRVNNQTKGTSQQIYLNREARYADYKITCTCPDNRWRRRECKHLDAVRAFLGLDKLEDFFATPASLPTPAPQQFNEQELREAYDALGF